MNTGNTGNAGNTRNTCNTSNTGNTENTWIHGKQRIYEVKKIEIQNSMLQYFI